MTPHTHTTIVPGCYRCELSADEAAAQVAEVAAQLRCPCGTTVCSTCGRCTSNDRDLVDPCRCHGEQS